jgi:hypothetical protein
MPVGCYCCDPNKKFKMTSIRIDFGDEEKTKMNGRMKMMVEANKAIL